MGSLNRSALFMKGFHCSARSFRLISLPIQGYTQGEEIIFPFIGRGKCDALRWSHLSVSVLRTHLLPGLLDSGGRQVTTDDGGLIDGVPALDRVATDRHRSIQLQFDLVSFGFQRSRILYFSQEKADIPARTAKQSFLMRALFSSNLSFVRFQFRRRLTSSAAVFARMPDWFIPIYSYKLDTNYDFCGIFVRNYQKRNER